jgi:ribosomal protein L40E
MNPELACRKCGSSQLQPSAKKSKVDFFLGVLFDTFRCRRCFARQYILKLRA